jgi:hypothetical protein
MTLALARISQLLSLIHVKPFIRHSNLQSIRETNIDLEKTASYRWSFSEEPNLPRRISGYNDWRVDPIGTFCDFLKRIPTEEDPIGGRSSLFPAGFGERHDLSQTDRSSTWLGRWDDHFSSFPVRASALSQRSQNIILGRR